MPLLQVARAEDVKAVNSTFRDELVEREEGITPSAASKAFYPVAPPKLLISILTTFEIS